MSLVWLILRHLYTAGYSLNDMGVIIFMKYSYRLILLCELYFCCSADDIGKGNDLE